MSAWRNAVDFHTPTLAAAQYAVLSALSAYANDDGIAYPSMATLAIRAHCTDRNAQRTVKQLEEAGYLKRIRQIRSNGSSGSNLYQLSPVLLDCVDGCRCPIAVRARRGAEIAATTGRNATTIVIPQRPKVFKKDDPSVWIAPPPKPGDPVATFERPAVEAIEIPARFSNDIVRGVSAALDPVIRAEHIWRAAYLGDSPAGMLRKKLSPLFGKEDHERVLTAWENYCNNVGAAYTNVDKFVATWGSWEAGVPSRDRDTMAAHREVFGS